jgi:hypothetical protein
MRMLLALSAIALTLASSGNTATVIPVGEFRSVALSHGGRVVVRHGAVPTHPERHSCSVPSQAGTRR